MILPPFSKLASVIFLMTLYAIPALGQSRTIRGRIVESGSRLPLSGARVSTGFAADTTTSSGEYRLSVAGSESAVRIRVTMLGFVPAERDVSFARGLTAEANFEMKQSPLGLDAVVVTGSAGPTAVREIGHSISQIRPSEVPEPIVSVDHLLASRLPGVAVLPATGMAGSGARIRLRGSASVALSNQPLVYVDGVRIRSEGYPKNVPPVGERSRGPNETASPLGDIDPFDIERVEIVRGPAATTLYGTEAAAGVIQIFTRRAAPGRTVWTTQLTGSISSVRPFGPPNEPYVRLEPWLKDASAIGYALSASGGGDVRYLLSTSYNHNEGVLPNDLEKRISVRGNFDMQPHRKLAVSLSSSMATNNISNTASGPNGHGLTQNAYRGPANATGVFTKESLDRILAWDIATDINHGILGLTGVFSQTRNTSHTITLGYDRASSDMRSLRPFGFVFTPQGILSTERWLSNTTTADYLGRSHLEIRGVGLTVAWGGQTIGSDISSVSGYAEGFPGPASPTLGNAATRLAFEARTKSVVAGVFSQATMELRDRIYLTAGLRVDGSSSFGADLGLQPFPRVSAAWILSEESFWPRVLGTLKLRAAYGEAGRAPKVFDADRTWAQVGYDGKAAFLPRSVGNTLLGPERSAETEVGFDAATPGGALRTEVTIYRRATKDALLPVQPAPSLGFLNPQLQNVGTFRTTGAELALNGTAEWRRISLDAGVSVSLNRTKAADLAGSPDFIIEEVAWISEGRPAPVLIGPRLRNPNDIADPDIEENYVFGPNMPTRVVGVSLALRLPRRIVISARAEYQGGSYMLDNASRSLFGQGAHVACESAYGRITGGQVSTLTAWERMWCVSTNVRRDGPILSGDFIKLRDASFTMPVPARLLRSRSATITFAARNYLLSKSSDIIAFDPEMGGRDGMFAPVRTIELGVPAPASLSVAIRATYW